MFYQSIWFWVIIVLGAILLLIAIGVFSRINKIGNMMQPGKKEKVRFCPKCHSMIREKTQLCPKCGFQIKPHKTKKGR